MLYGRWHGAGLHSIGLVDKQRRRRVKINRTVSAASRPRSILEARNGVLPSGFKLVINAFNFAGCQTKRRRIKPQCSRALRDWRDAVPVFAADEMCLTEAIDAVVTHSWSFWDAMIWATAKRAG